MRGKQRKKMASMAEEYFRWERASLPAVDAREVYRDLAHRGLTDFSYAEPDRRGMRMLQLLRFARGQLRYLSKRTCALSIAVFAGIVALWVSGVDRGIAPGLMGALGALLALVGLPELLAGRACGMAELESACLFNAHAVVWARMLALGCIHVVTAMFALVVVPPGLSLVASAMCMAAAYLAALAMGLVFARRSASVNAAISAVAGASLVVGAAVCLAVFAPSFFVKVTTGAWALATAATGAWAYCELRRMLKASSWGYLSAGASAS